MFEWLRRFLHRRARERVLEERMKFLVFRNALFEYQHYRRALQFEKDMKRKRKAIKDYVS